MKLEKADYKEIMGLRKPANGLRLDRRAVLDEFLNADNYDMKLVFGREEKEEMLGYCARTGKSPKDYYLSVYNSYACIISKDKKYKDKIEIKRFSKNVDKSPMTLYLVRKDKTFVIGDDCQRRGYVW